MSDSNIGWTNKTWNPTTGCTKVSEGCRNCYADTLAQKLQKQNPNGKYRNGFKLTVHPKLFNEPTKWKKASLVFVNSMSDLFHKDVKGETLDALFDVMEESASQHIYQILTKRPDRMKRFLDYRWGIRPPPKNIWVGTSVEDHRVTERIDILRETPAAVRFVSFEPLIGPVIPDLTGIHWAIIGGESGPERRPMNKDWVESLSNSCKVYNTAFFFKQWGGFRPGGDNKIDGVKYENYPEAISWLRGATA